MNYTYECCKKKQNIHTVCMRCFSHFHLSCLERKKSAKVVDGGSCLCSIECQRSYKREEEEKVLQVKKLKEYTQKIKNLEENIFHIEEENEIKVKELSDQMDKMSLLGIEQENQIRTLRRNSETFENEVLLSESEYEAKIKALEKSEKELHEKLQASEKMVASILEDLNASRRIEKELRDEVNKLKITNQTLVSKIKDLDEENERNREDVQAKSEEIEKLNEDLKQLKKEEQNFAKAPTHKNDREEQGPYMCEGGIPDENLLKLEKRLYGRLLLQLRKNLLPEIEDKKTKPKDVDDCKKAHSKDKDDGEKTQPKKKDDNKTAPTKNYADVIKKSETRNVNNKQEYITPRIVINEEQTVLSEKEDHLRKNKVREDFWTTVGNQRKRSRNRSAIEGNSDIVNLPPDAVFTSAEKKAWLYVGRVSLKATEDNIKNFLVQKFPNREFTVNINQKYGLREFSSEDISFFGRECLTSIARQPEKKREEYRENEITVIHQNLQSIGNCVDELNEFLQAQNKCTFLCVTEHWKTASQLPIYKIEHYNLAASFCRTLENKHGGSAIFARDGLLGKVRKEATENSVENHIEISACEFKINKTKIVVSAVYRTPSGDFETFLQRLEKLVALFTNEANKTVIIAGDFNVNFVSKDSIERLQMCSMLNSYGVYPTISENTRITETAATCVDNVLVNRCSISGEILHSQISDHTAQKLTVTIGKTETKKVMRRIFNQENIDTFLNALGSLEWMEIREIDERDVNGQCEWFMKLYLACFNGCFPLKRITLGSRQRRRMDPEVAECKNRRDILYTVSSVNGM
ncbi:intracellular protein transport protein USO1-like [Harmonia axyridis]|uniref:intracellular protein transport protein USO1-like n=1 Tax=Harmonia axyridis TaxID=115357 RepID=UPI001E277BA2|nr:intracellular protein transport protein USO1-like [Harmonia axyridis]